MGSSQSDLKMYEAKEFLTKKNNHHLELDKNTIYIGKINSKKQPNGLGMLMFNYEYDEEGGYEVFDIYYGNFLDSYKHGKGVCNYADGTIFSGNWNNDSIQGNGVYVLGSGHRLCGTFIDKEGIPELNGCGKHYDEHDNLIFEGFFSRSLYLSGTAYYNNHK